MRTGDRCALQKNFRGACSTWHFHFKLSRAAGIASRAPYTEGLNRNKCVSRHFACSTPTPPHRKMRCASRCAMKGFRGVACLLIVCGAVWVASYRSVWYDNHVFARKDPALEFSAGDVLVRGKYARIVMFFSVPLILAAFCGACWEAVWMTQQLRSVRGAGMPRSATGSHIDWKIRRLVKWNFRPLGTGSP